MAVGALDGSPGPAWEDAGVPAVPAALTGAAVTQLADTARSKPSGMSLPYIAAFGPSGAEVKVSRAGACRDQELTLKGGESGTRFVIDIGRDASGRRVPRRPLDRRRERSKI